MPTVIRERYDDEVARGRTLAGPEGWAALETAHVLSQAWAGPHVRSHWRMLGRATRERDGREIAGQLVRLVVAGPGTLLHRYPVGNTGRARVSARLPMPMADDVAELLAHAGVPTR